MTATKPLAGLGVVITRPSHQAAALAAAVTALGADAIRFPTLEILATHLPPQQQQHLQQLDRYQIALFISPNAVSYGLQQLAAPWPTGVQIAAVGEGSARTLKQHGLPVDLFPTHRYDSEALLALPPLQQVVGQKIVIFRGVGGRELLADTLRERGAEVDYLEVYQRALPQTDPKPLIQRWQQGQPGVIVTTSNESLANLCDMVGKAAERWLKHQPLLVISQRGEQLAQELGFTGPILRAEKPSEPSICATLTANRNRILSSQTV